VEASNATEAVRRGRGSFGACFTQSPPCQATACGPSLTLPPALPSRPTQIGSQPAKSTTVIAASNKAIDAWLAANNMTMADVAAREALADRIVGYSVGWVGGSS
jgi:hypothetical protein